MVVSGCNDSDNRDQSTRFINDNGGLNYSQWDGWVVTARQNYYLVQFYTIDDATGGSDEWEKIVFWKGKDGNILVRTIKNGEIAKNPQTLVELAENEDYKRSFCHLTYQELYNAIQLIYNYSILYMRVDDGVPTVISKSFQLRRQSSSPTDWIQVADYHHF